MRSKWPDSVINFVTETAKHLSDKEIAVILSKTLAKRVSPQSVARIRSRAGIYKIKGRVSRYIRKASSEPKKLLHLVRGSKSVTLRHINKSEYQTLDKKFHFVYRLPYWTVVDNPSERKLYTLVDCLVHIGRLPSFLRGSNKRAKVTMTHS